MRQRSGDKPAGALRVSFAAVDGFDAVNRKVNRKVLVFPLDLGDGNVL